MMAARLRNPLTLGEAWHADRFRGQNQMSAVRLLGSAIVAVGAATLATVWIAQYVFHVHPCHLCLQQRYAYYAAIPLAVVTAIGATVGAPRRLLLSAFIAIALIMAASTALATYHVGVELQWWAGPQDCSGPRISLGPAKDLWKRMQEGSVPRCDVAVRPLLGISYAGYNALISTILVVTASFAALVTRRIP